MIDKNIISPNQKADYAILGDMKITIEIDCNGRNFVEKFTPNTAQRKDIFRNLMPDRDVFIMNVKEMIRQGKTQRWIANELGIAVGTVNKYSKL